MSEILTTLRQQAKELRLLAADLDRVADDWERQLDATHFLGQGVPVEAWSLADHFLLTWADWHGLRTRYDRYFGAKDDFWPQWWTDLDGRCKQTAGGLWKNASLQNLIAEAWRTETLAINGGNLARPAALDATKHVAADLAAESDALARHVMSDHERMLLVSMFANGRQAAAAPMVGTAVDQSRRVIAAFDHASLETRAEVVWQLRNYRHSTLQLSWLTRNGPQFQRPKTALEHALEDDESSARLVEALIEPMLYELRRDDDRRILTRIVRAVSEIGYERFFDDATSRDMLGGLDSPLGAADVEVIPGDQRDRAAAAVVALSRRGRRGASLQTVLEKTCQRLASAAAPARAVVLLSDTWDGGVFAATARDRFAAQHALGVAFVFLLVGLPEHIVAPVPVLLNGQAVQSGPRRIKID